MEMTYVIVGDGKNIYSLNNIHRGTFLGKNMIENEEILYSYF